MPIAQVRGVTLNYEIVGEHGPWMAISPGGRRGLEEIRYLARPLAAAGYRVLLHDRRNCGASDVAFDGREGEFEIWADDLHELLSQHGALPALVGGSSSGCRLSIMFALRHPQAVRALLLWRVTGGRWSAERLADNYYGQFIKLAQTGGMAAVCQSEHFRDRIASNPANRERLMAIDPADFIAVMESWRAHLLKGADMPIIGATAEQLASIKVPTFIIPGNDRVHGAASGRIAHQHIPGSELFDVFPQQHDLDVGPIEEWEAKADEHTTLIVDFLSRRVGDRVEPALTRGAA